MWLRLGAWDLTGFGQCLEVAEIFEVKLSFFLDPANAKQMSRDLGGRSRHVYVFEPEGRIIWGITAALLFDFAGRLNAGHAKESA